MSESIDDFPKQSPNLQVLAEGSAGDRVILRKTKRERGVEANEVLCMKLTRKQWMMLAVLVLGAFVTVLNQTLVTPALPSIMIEMRVDQLHGPMADHRVHAGERHHDSHHGVSAAIASPRAKPVRVRQ